MTSNINPNDIDGNYPVAGQDNNSQGFRDNFTNTSTNFQYAADEITDLQNKAVLKAALTGTTLNNNMNGALLNNAQLQQMTESVVPLGTLTGSVTLDFSLGSYQTLTTNGPISLGFSNLPAAGVLGSIAGMLGTIQATEALKYLTGVGELITNRFIIFNALNMTFRTSNFKKNDNCPVCGLHPTVTELTMEEMPTCDIKRK